MTLKLNILRGLCVLSVLTLAACSQHGAGLHNGQPVTAPLVQDENDPQFPPQLLQVPVPTLDNLGDLPASPSTWVTRSTSSINGVDAIAQGGQRNRVEGSALAVIPGGDDEYAFAVYKQDGITFDKPVDLTLDVAPAAVIPGGDDEYALKFWLGVSDYTTFKWKWFGPFDNSNTSSLPKGARFVRRGTSSAFGLTINSADDHDRYVSQGDLGGICRMSYVIVTTATGDPDHPNAVKVNITNTDVSPDYVTNNPHYVPVFQPNVEQSLPPGSPKHPSSNSRTIDLGWEHIPSLGPADDRNIANTYQVWRRGSNQTFPDLIDTLPAPETSYTDPPPGGYPQPGTQPPTPGVKYTYYIRALNVEQGATPRAPSAPAIYPIDPPDGIRTELTDDDAHVYLSWAPAPGAVSYDVLYQDQFNSIPTVLRSGVTGTSLTFVPDAVGELYFYSVVANGRDIDSNSTDAMRGFVPDYPSRGQGGQSIIVNLGGGQALRFLQVPGGNVELASSGQEWGHNEDEDRYQDVWVNPCYMSECEITNAQWNQFMDPNNGDGYHLSSAIWGNDGFAWRNTNNVAHPPHWLDQLYNSGPSAADADYPVVDISWYEANAFAHWVDTKFQNDTQGLTGHVELPNEAQWEWAAEGPTQQDELWLYPWAEMRGFNGGVFNNGDDGQDGLLCNNQLQGSTFDPGLTCKVDNFLNGRSWCGLFNMSGNVAEWTSDNWRYDYPVPWGPATYDGSENTMAVRGGRCLDSCSDVRTSSRQGFAVDFALQPGYTFEGVGIRLVLNANPGA